MQLFFQIIHKISLFCLNSHRNFSAFRQIHKAPEWEIQGLFSDNSVWFLNPAFFLSIFYLFVMDGKLLYSVGRGSSYICINIIPCLCTDKVSIFTCICNIFIIDVCHQYAFPVNLHQADGEILVIYNNQSKISIIPFQKCGAVTCFVCVSQRILNFIITLYVEIMNCNNHL